MSIDDTIKALPGILERLERIEQKQDLLISLLRAGQLDLTRPFYDINQLMELGISRNKGYEMLRAHGRYVAGRRRITAAKLINLFDGEEAAE